MKRATSIFIVTLFLIAGCSDGNRSSTVIKPNDHLITVDVTKSYPKKELILQDFMDVEYIALETNDEFLTQGVVRAIGKDIIVVINSSRDGDIFIYDRNGKGIRKINRKGQSGEEYTGIIGIVLDEENNEIFVHERRIWVYDLNGTYKRSFKYRHDYMFVRFYNYDSDHLFAYDATVEDEGFKKRSAYHAVISKQDGSIISEVQVPFKEKIPTSIQYQTEDRVVSSAPDNINAMIPYQGNWILTQPSADTIYMYLPDDSMFPFIVRTPSIQSMNPVVFLFPQVITDQYYFMRTVKKAAVNDKEQFPTTNLVYDREEQELYECVVYNDDFSTQRMAEMSQQRRIDDGIAFWQKLEPSELIEAYNNNELKGRLEEIAAELDEEDNPVIMLVKHKK